MSTETPESASNAPTLIPRPTLFPEVIATIEAEYNVILTSQDAITRTLAHIPPEQHPHSAIARLMSRQSFDQWQNPQPMASSGSNVLPTQPWDMDPMWLTAVHIDGIPRNVTFSEPVNNVLGVMQEIRATRIASDPNAGGSSPMYAAVSSQLASAYFVVWSARTGNIYSEGPLLSVAPRSYSSVITLQDENIAIERGRYPYSDNQPTPTP